MASASGPAPTEAGSAAGGSEIVPGREGHHGREVDARVVEAGDEGLQPTASLGEGQGAQVLLALEQDVVDAQMRRKLRDELRRHGLPVQALLQHVEALHPAFAHDQQFAVDGALEIERLDKIGKGAGDVLAGAGIDPPHRSPVAALARRGLKADAVPFPLGQELGRLRAWRNPRPPEGARAWTGETGRDCRIPASARGLRPRRRDPRKEPPARARSSSTSSGSMLAELSDSRLGKPGRDADPQLPGDQLDERPAPGFVESVHPAGNPSRQVALARGGESLDHLGQGRDVRRRVVVAEPYLSSPLRGGVGGGGGTTG